MSKRFVIVLMLMTAATLAPAAPAVRAQDAKAALSAASKAMGGDSLKTIAFTGAGSEYSFGQAFNPSSPWPVWAEKSYTRAINYETMAWRTERALGDIPADRKGGGLAPAAMQAVVLNANSPWAQAAELWITPHGFLRGAASN